MSKKIEAAKIFGYITETCEKAIEAHARLAVGESDDEEAKWLNGYTRIVWNKLSGLSDSTEQGEDELLKVRIERATLYEILVSLRDIVGWEIQEIEQRFLGAIDDLNSFHSYAYKTGEI